MTHWTEAADLWDAQDRAQPGSLARHAPGAFAFLMSAALGVYLVFLRPVAFAPPAADPSVLRTESFGSLAPITPPPAVALSAPPQANPFGDIELKGLLADSQFALEENPVPLPPVAPSDLRSAPEMADVPTPPRRPSELSREVGPTPRASDVARLEPRPAATPEPVASPSLFEKLFGNAAINSGRSQEQRLAYAAPPAPASSAASGGVSAVSSGRNGPAAPSFGGFLRGVTFGNASTSRFGDRVAIYDISAHVVYLPDGTKLEAHSGLGDARDDPNKVDERMRGPTPPATYALTAREGSFHGVDALRLTPVDSGVYGRAGLLAHTYMLGANGDSNGCVSFRDYEAFLRAYRSGQINKLVVVTRL